MAWIETQVQKAFTFVQRNECCLYSTANVYKRQTWIQYRNGNQFGFKIGALYNIELNEKITFHANRNSLTNNSFSIIMGFLISLKYGNLPLIQIENDADGNIEVFSLDKRVTA